MSVTDKLFDLSPVAKNSKHVKESDELSHLHKADADDMFLDIVKTKGVDFNVRPALIDAEFEDSIDATPVLRMTIHDPDWGLLNSGAFDKAVDLRVTKGRFYRLNDIEINDDDFSLTFMTRNAAYLSHHSAPKKVARRAGHGKPKKPNSTRAEFIKMLVNTVKVVKIPFYCPQLHKRQDVEKLDPDDRITNDKKRKSGLPNDGIKVKHQTADEEQIKNLEIVLRVGTDLKAPRRAMVGAVMCATQESGMRRSATNGVHVGLFQQDPAYWPATRDPAKDAPAFFKKFIPIIRANPQGALGDLIDQVQGSGQPGAYDTWRSEAENTIKQYVGGGGGKSLIYTAQYEYENQKYDDGSYESYLACIYRLAEEVNWRAYWVANTLHYMSEDDLFKGRSRAKLDRHMDGFEGISASFTRSDNMEQGGGKGAQPNSMQLSVRMDRWVYPIGTVVTWEHGMKDMRGRWLVTNITRPMFSTLGTITLSKPLPELPEPRSPQKQKNVKTGAGGSVDDGGGARSIVEDAVQIAQEAGGDSVYVGSDYRAGSVTTSGNVSDHAENNARRAARDIGVQGIDLLVGPPSPHLDKAVVAIGEAFGRDYNGGTTIIDTFQWHGFQVQIIWRTPAYGGHMGHIHVGVHLEGGGGSGSYGPQHLPGPSGG